jgi:hypothetical protein
MWDSTVLSLPLVYALLTQYIVRIALGFVMDINNYEGQEHLARLNLVDCTKPPNVMSGWVYVCAPLPY